MQIKAVFFCIIMSLGLVACQQKNVKFKNGTWRGVFINDSSIEIPFNFEVYDSAGNKQVAFINGAERLNINEVQVTGDTVIISTPLYATEIKAQLSPEGLVGNWKRTLPDKTQSMKFYAKPDADWRFIQTPDSAKRSIDGRWSVLMTKSVPPDTTLAVGEFSQNANDVSGTFMTNFGDYRFLYGQLNGNRLSLSSYGGSVPVLFTATVTDDHALVDGMSYSGPSSLMKWEGKRDADAMLSDPYTLTKLKKGTDRLNFTFPDVEGNRISITDDRFANKVVVIQFLGSWCPNCMDETAFLSPFYDRYKPKGVEVVGLAYERYSETEKAKKAVFNLIKRFDVSYPILLTGYQPADVLQSVPELQNFKAFPTTILLDKQGRVASIHTGFNGPATGDAYTDYIENFERQIDRLLANN